MNNNVFRQKSINKINSPESLNDYVKVTNPSVWIILAGVLILIIGALVFGMVGKVDTKVNAVAEVNNGTITVYVDEADAKSIETGMAVNIGGTVCEITNIPDRPVKAMDVDEYVLHVGNMDYSQWVYPVVVGGTCNDGVYAASVTVERVSPMSYVFN